MSEYVKMVKSLLNVVSIVSVANEYSFEITILFILVLAVVKLSGS